jgi:cytochrome c oxidase subunit II
MIGIAITAGILLVLAIIFLLFRLHVLMGILRGAEQKTESQSNRVNALLFVFFLVFALILLIWYSVANFDKYHIPIASEHGVTTDRLFWITMAITGVVFIITHVLLFVFPFRYQFRADRRALFFPDNNRLEFLWTIVPAFVLTILVVYGLIVWNKVMAPAPAEAEVVEVMGYQFAWRVRYPGKDNQLGGYDFRLIDVENEFGMDFRDRAAFDDFVPREMYLPKGRPVEFQIRARDVLHSVFAPHFRLKMDAVPGMPTRFWFVPTKTTAEMREETGNPEFNYEIACTEVCGRGHFSMRLLVVVVEPEEYDRWKAGQEPWLSKNPDYLAKVPENLRDLALVKAGISLPDEN